jgi:hypothetical protein
MIIRIAASFVVVLGIGVVLVANETIARSGGGFAGGRSVSSFPALHPSGIRRGAVGERAAVHSHAFRTPFLRTPFLRHRQFGFGWPFAAWDGTPGYQPYPDQAGYGAPSELAAPVYPTVYPTLGYSPMGSLGYPAAGSARTSVYVIPYRPGCNSQSQKLPWRDGGERSITIVRC